MNLANLVNAALFQLVWFGCVLGGAVGSSIWGAGALGGLLAFSALAAQWRSDLIFALGAALVGLILDTVWIHAGVLDYTGRAVAPGWIVLLWAGVGLTLNHSLAVFRARPWLGGLLAGASAPLSYLGGERLAAVVVPEPWALVYVAVAWGVLFTVAFAVLGRVALHYSATPESVAPTLGLPDFER